MKIIKRMYQYKIDLFLPLVAILLGILIMGLRKPISVQASMAMPMPQAFIGEYSFDRTNWYVLGEDNDISALKGDLYLRGRFEKTIPENSRLYFYSDHIGSEISINGQLLEQDIIFEIEQYGIKVQPSMCCREWKFHYFEKELSTDTLVEIHLKNPHSFGNKKAYKYFLETLCCTPNEQEFLALNLRSAGRPYHIIGIIFVIIGALLLCSAIVALCMRVPIGVTIVQTGLLAEFMGGFFLLDTVDLSFRNDNHILSTFGWQICLMYSVYLLGTMVRDVLVGKWKKVANCVISMSAAVDMAMILLAFAGVVLMYDTLGVWVMIQYLTCPILIICCIRELLFVNRKKRADLVVFLVSFICIMLDCTGIFSSIYSRGVLTKAAVILLFALKLVQFSGSIIISFKTSSWADKLEKELEESRIAIMLSQIQPHFIFNVLGTIRGLCRENPQQAWLGLGDFSMYLRANMSALTNEKLIPFEKELVHVETYIRLEQMRMGEKLKVVYDIQEKNFSIPPLMLQPLVENAVKHGLFYKLNGGTIIIRSIQAEGKVVISVQDDGVGFEAAAKEADFDQREHHGLANVRSRVEKMLGGSLRIDSHPEHGSIVTLEFPVDNYS